MIERKYLRMMESKIEIRKADKKDLEKLTQYLFLRRKKDRKCDVV